MGNNNKQKVNDNKPYKAAHHPMTCDVISNSISQDIVSQSFGIGERLTISFFLMFPNHFRGTTSATSKLPRLDCPNLNCRKPFRNSKTLEDYVLQGHCRQEPKTKVIGGLPNITISETCQSNIKMGWALTGKKKE